MRVLLVVDDSDDHRRAMRRVFERRGWVVFECGSLGEARLVLTRGAVMIDAIAVDWSFPGAERAEQAPARQVLAMATSGQAPDYRPIPCALVTGRDAQQIDPEDRVGFFAVVEKVDTDRIFTLFSHLDERPGHGGTNGTH